MSARGTYRTTRTKYGHTIRFDGGQGYMYIDVTYDGATYPIDVINLYDYERGASDQQTRKDFEAAVREYLRDLDQHDADAYAEQ